jgi:hypothetical protein
MTEKKGWRIWEKTVEQVTQYIFGLIQDAKVERVFGDSEPLFSPKQQARIGYLETEISGFIVHGDKDKLTRSCEEWGRAHVWAFENKLENLEAQRGI